MSGFCNTFDLKSLIREETCYKHPEGTSSINLTLSNNPCSFQNFCYWSCLLDFHRMVVTVMKHLSKS